MDHGWQEKQTYLEVVVKESAVYNQLLTTSLWAYDNHMNDDDFDDGKKMHPFNI